MIITIAGNIDDTLISVGDTIISVPVNTVNSTTGFDFNNQATTSSDLFYGDIVTYHGVVLSFNTDTIITDLNSPLPTAGDFIIVVKSGRAESSGVKGSFATLTLKHVGNPPTRRPELFAVSTEVIESSK